MLVLKNIPGFYKNDFKENFLFFPKKFNYAIADIS
jgi:hypothetical protein